ncbi:MAG TPA: thioredoxin domain-containing protein [Candidatus Woesebacteria bacterium]|nr:thioredoxin domain-containing protein [Candidatus Woesebacteria bacterium]HNS65472.1 thioredoxin domain-containing protein [Candidatus Woesebacteria bacterium]
MTNKEIEAEIPGKEVGAAVESVQEQTGPNSMDEVGYEQPESLDFDELLRDAGDTPVLIDFYADWCAPCKMLEPTIQQLANQYDGRVIVAKVNIEDNPDLITRFNIFSIPRVAIFRNGEIAANFLGLKPFQEYVTTIDALLAEPEAESGVESEIDEMPSELADVIAPAE